MGEPLFGWAVLVVLVLQRVAELFWAHANTARLLARGGVLCERDGMAGLVVVHVGWFAAIGAERVFLGARMPAATAVPLLVVLACVEGLRAWMLATLGRRWTVRVVVLPGERPVNRGPYRFLRHPNYLVLTLELLLVPLWLGAWRTALAVLLPHAWALRTRLRAEERAWREVAAQPLGSPR